MGILDDLMAYGSRFIDKKETEMNREREQIKNNPLGSLLGNVIMAMSMLPAGPKRPPMGSRPQPSMDELWPGMNLAGQSPRSVFGQGRQEVPLPPGVSPAARAEAEALARAAGEPTMNELWPGMNLQGKSARDIFGR